MTGRAVSISREEGKEIFESVAKSATHYLIFFALIPILPLIFVTVSLFLIDPTALESGMVGAYLCAVLFLGVIGIFDAWGSAKKIAIKQCLVVSDKLGVRLNSRQVIELISQPFAMGVFESYVKMIEDIAPDAVPDGFFEGASGSKADSYRRLVEYLWGKE